MLGLFERTPRFVKRYDDLATRIGEAAETYAAEVRARRFPTAEQTYRPKSAAKRRARRRRPRGLGRGRARLRSRKSALMLIATGAIALHLLAAISADWVTAQFSICGLAPARRGCGTTGRRG